MIGRFVVECDDPTHEGNRVRGDEELACVDCEEFAADMAAEARFDRWHDERGDW